MSHYQLKASTTSSPSLPWTKSCIQMPYPSTHVEWIFVWSRKIVEFKKVFNAVVWFFVEASFYKVIISHCANHSQKQTQVFTFKCLVYSTDLNFHPTQQWFKFTTSEAQATDKSPEFAQRGLLKLQINPPLIYMWPLIMITIIIGFSETTITYYSFL